MKFVRKDTPTIMDGLVVRYKLSSGLLGDGEISASRNGVCISGYFPTMSEEAAILFLDTFRKALIQHRALEGRDRAVEEHRIPHTSKEYLHPLNHPLLKA